MTQGPTEALIIKQCSQQRRPLPRAIAEAPELDLGLEFAYTAFFELGSCRAYGWGIGPIPWTSIYDYARAHELDEEDTEDFAQLIRSMDISFLEYHSRKAKEDSDRASKAK